MISDRRFFDRLYQRLRRQQCAERFERAPAAIPPRLEAIPGNLGCTALDQRPHIRVDIIGNDTMTLVPVAVS